MKYYAHDLNERIHGSVDEWLLLRYDMQELRQTISRATKRMEFERRLAEFMAKEQSA